LGHNLSRYETFTLFLGGYGTDYPNKAESKKRQHHPLFHVFETLSYHKKIHCDR
jgi:hypothetical protein